APALSPRGDVFAYIANTTGLPGLWLQPVGGGFPRQLTALADQRVAAFEWSPDGRSLAISGNDRDPSQQDVMVLDVETGEATRLVTGGVHYAGAFSPDGRYLVHVEPLLNTHQDRKR